ncbi:MAG: glycosyltransferase [Anaerolineales bacterium]|nr:glycosyltransferase [Anaerolineales bacterium]
MLQRPAQARGVTRLLFLTPQPPYPPRQGTAIRNWGLIKHLSARHTLSLLTFAEDDQSVAEPLRNACRRVVVVPTPRRTRLDRLRTLLSPRPDLAERLASTEYARALNDLLREEKFDFVHVEGLELARYLPMLSAAGVRVIYDAHNAEYVLQQRAFKTDLHRLRRWPAALYSLIQWPRLKRFEAATLRAVHAVTCVSQEDATALRALVPELQPVLVPNGIDVQDYVDFLQHAPRATSAVSRPPSVVFTGKMDYRPNVDAVLWFAADIWPLIRAQQPEVQFIIVGQKPAPAVQALHGRDAITVTGAVDDVRPYIAGASVYVAPLRLGGGTRFKLLEAMALQTPIVSTTLGAEGFAVADGRELLLADSPHDFAGAVLRLLTDSELRVKLAEAGLACVRKNYDWSVIVPALERTYEARP